MTDALTYKRPQTPTRKFRVGDVVETLHRDGTPMETVRVVYAGPRVVRTSCGRRWDQRGWWFPGPNAWPFPTIRLQAREESCDA